jgi:hypothetical protein
MRLRTSTQQVAPENKPAAQSTARPTQPPASPAKNQPKQCARPDSVRTEVSRFETVDGDIPDEQKKTQCHQKKQ